MCDISISRVAHSIVHVSSQCLFSLPLFHSSVLQYGWHGDQHVSIMPVKHTDQGSNFPASLSIYELLSQYLDLQASPTQVLFRLSSFVLIRSIFVSIRLCVYTGFQFQTSLQLARSQLPTFSSHALVPIFCSNLSPSWPVSPPSPQSSSC